MSCVSGCKYFALGPNARRSGGVLEFQPTRRWCKIMMAVDNGLWVFDGWFGRTETIMKTTTERLRGPNSTATVDFVENRSWNWSQRNHAMTGMIHDLIDCWPKYLCWNSDGKLLEFDHEFLIRIRSIRSLVNRCIMEIYRVSNDNWIIYRWNSVATKKMQLKFEYTDFLHCIGLCNWM